MCKAKKINSYYKRGSIDFGPFCVTTQNTRAFASFSGRCEQLTVDFSIYICPLNIASIYIFNIKIFHVIASLRVHSTVYNQLSIPSSFVEPI